MLYNTSVSTLLGTFHLTCDRQGLTSIVLPGENNPAEAAPALPGSASAPEFLGMSARQIIEYCEGQRTAFAVPLSFSGTPFQQRVWGIMQTIPYGRTMSYGEIAEKLGSRHKARAVGRAANANPLPLVIPCHRVIGSDGSLTGFAGGIPLKQALLDLEQNLLRCG